METVCGQYFSIYSNVTVILYSWPTIMHHQCCHYGDFTSLSIRKY
uniref:Uncharacterized protein n=1 Tax=Anguilla anguilla TaxID=7936 RepID=A0A0E9QNV6_ANGAN